MNALIGTWNLVEWDCTINGAYHNHPFGRDAQGRLMYTPEGTMMAILMKANRPNFATPSLILGSADEKISAVDGYVSYSGTYHTAGDLVIHHVTFSLLPNWIGTDLVRQMAWTNDPSPQLILSTQPQPTRSGKIVVNRLRWRKE